MGLFNLFHNVDINVGIAECKTTDGAVLLNMILICD